MPAQQRSSVEKLAERIESLPLADEAPPKVLQGMTAPDQRPQPVPRIVTPEASQIAKAVMDASPAITRKQIATEMRKHGCEFQAKQVDLAGEIDDGGVPSHEFYKCLGVVTAINWCRRAENIESALLTKAEGQESRAFVQFSKASGVILDLGG